MQKKIIQSITFPFLFLLLIWIIHIIAQLFNYNLVHWGIFPRKISGLYGILSSPLVHSDFQHLISNSIPFFVLASILIYFYPQISFRIIAYSWLLQGIWVWLAGRMAYHIGASGLVYAIASFLFFNGIFHRNRPMAAISLLIVFLYGGLIWGLFPTQKQISWEGHLGGFLAGIIVAYGYYDRIKTLLTNDLTEKIRIENEFESKNSTIENAIITYHYIEKK